MSACQPKPIGSVGFSPINEPVLPVVPGGLGKEARLVILVLVRWLENLRKDMGDAVQSGDVKRVDRNVIDAESGFGGTRNWENLALVNDDLQLFLLETARKLELLVEGRVVVQRRQLVVVVVMLTVVIVMVVVLTIMIVVVVVVLAIVIAVVLVLAIMVMVVFVVSIMVMRVLDVEDMLGEHYLFREAMISEHLCQCALAERREEEEDELLGELGEGVVGGDKISERRIAVEDGLVLLLTGLVVKVPANMVLTVDFLHGRRPCGELAREQERSVEDGGRREERVVDPVNVAVLGFDVRLGDLGIEVDLKSGWHQLLLHTNPQRSTVVGSELGTKSGSKSVVLGQFQAAISFRETVILENGTKDELEDLVTSLLLVIIVVAVTSEESVVSLEEAGGRWLGHQRLKQSIFVLIIAILAIVIVVIIMMMRIRNTRVLRSKKRDRQVPVIQYLDSLTGLLQLQQLYDLAVVFVILLQELPDGLLRVVVKVLDGVIDVRIDV
jgi:hypothetical protein